MYPILLDVKDRPCLVVGGGGVALRKAQGLLAEGARVSVVAPQIIPALEALCRGGGLRHVARSYQAGEAAGYALVFAATDDRGVNQQVAREAKEAGVWVNVADDPESCSFFLPARVNRGALQLAIGSRGGAPFVVRRLRQALEGKFGQEWGEWTEAAARFRKAVRGRGLSAAAQEACFDRFFACTVDLDRWSSRVPSPAEMEGWIASPQDAQCQEPGPAEPTSADRPRPCGQVALVGAGPGDPGLLTLRARERLARAEAVVYDHLAAAALPCDLGHGVALHCVGKRAGHHPVPQEEINALLIRLARAGLRVVRLKGGDPYVFGRGAEEAEALAREGIPFEVIPGVTAALAASAYAGIPVTHRSEAVRVCLVTAHESAKGDGPQVDWGLLAKDPHSTLVGYMGVGNLPAVVRALLDGGMDPATPAALIENGTTARQRLVSGTLADLVERGKRLAVKPPSLFVIGPAVRHAAVLGWFEKRPLFGQRLLLVAAPDGLAEALREDGAEVVSVGLPVSEAARVVIGASPLTGWVIRTRDELEALEEERGACGFGPEVAVFCLDPEAAEAAARLGFGRVARVARDRLRAALSARRAR